MRTTTSIVVAAAAAVSTVVALACTPPPSPLTPPAPQDNVVEVSAAFCARPAADVAFPTKLLIVGDVGEILAVDDVDPNGARYDAVRDLITASRDRNDVLIALVGAGSNAYVDPPQVGAAVNPAFIPAAQWTEPAFLTADDVENDLGAALDAAHSLLLQDMLRADAAELARTRYVIVIASSGDVLPVCCTAADEVVGAFSEPFGCADPSAAADPNATYCDGVVEASFCNDQGALDTFRANVGAAADIDGEPDFGDGLREPVAGFVAGGDYNRVAQLQAAAQSLVDVGAAFGTRVEIDANLLFPTAATQARLDDAQLDECRSQGLMQSFAAIGSGVFAEATTGDEVSFAAFDTGPQDRRFAVASTLLRDANAIGARADSDGDGVSDDVDAAPGDFDADDDGYRDGLTSDGGAACPEATFDGVDRTDVDGDRLNGCEEALFGSDARNADTNGDGIPDGVAVQLGLNPIGDPDVDSDLDGTPDSAEVSAGHDPRDGGDVRELTTVVRLVDEGVVDDRECYSFAGRTRIVATADGQNRVELVVTERPQANPTARRSLRIACADVAFVAGSAPAAVSFSDDDFVDLDDPAAIDAIEAGASACSR